MALTLVVVLGTGDSVATTPPLCPLRPESGSGVGRVLGGGGPATWARPLPPNSGIVTMTLMILAREGFEVNDFILIVPFGAMEFLEGMTGWVESA